MSVKRVYVEKKPEFAVKAVSIYDIPAVRRCDMLGTDTGCRLYLE